MTMPTVEAVFGGDPKPQFNQESAPESLKIQELVAGTGRMIRKGDTISVHYHGVVWGKEKPFDSSFERQTPASFRIGVGQVIRGWDMAIPGHNVGSRLLISIPPEYGYGSRGVPQAGIEPGDTLVFVVDIEAVR